MRIFSIIGTLRRHIKIAKQSGYPRMYKLHILRVLNAVFLKSLFKRNGREFTQKLFGFTVSAYDYNSFLLLFKEVFVRKEYYFKADNQDLAIIDCGANIGMSVLYFKFLYPNCSIIAIEPNPEAFVLLEKNIAQNKLTKVRLIHKALTNESGEVEFFTGEKKTALRASLFSERAGGNSVIVQTEQLSRIMQTHNFDMVKMDIEGAEYEVIGGLVLNHKLSASHRYMIEYHHRINSQKSSLSRFLKPFEDVGFEYNIKASRVQKGCFQDILLSFYKEE